MDLQTLMAEKDSYRSKDGEKKKRRSGEDLGIESFDPVNYVAKERAETGSMWLVLAFSIFVACIMRYTIMPGLDPSNADLLYALPLMFVFLLPTLHRNVMPKKWVEHYKGSTWFKATFLYVFSWLAVSFLLINPPMGDIVAPNVSSNWGIIMEDGEDDHAFKMAESGVLNITQGYNDSWIVMAFSDNDDPSHATYNATLSNVTKSWMLSDESSKFSVIGENDERLLMSEIDTDMGVAWAFPSDLNIGTYTLVVTVLEDGNPWTNSRTLEWTVLVSEPIV